MESLEQKFARTAYEQVQAYAEQHPEGSKERKQYGSMAHKLPILVRQAGLVQALEFVNSRGKDAQRSLLGDLAVAVGQDNAAALLQRSRVAELADYTFLTHRVMLALKWYKRFAQSVLKVSPTEEEP